MKHIQRDDKTYQRNAGIEEPMLLKYHKLIKVYEWRHLLKSTGQLLILSLGITQNPKRVLS